MDDAIDEMQKTAGAVDLYDVTEFEPEMRDIAGLIVDAARLTVEALPLLRKISANGPRLHELTERLVRMEGHADEIHAAGLKRLFKEYRSEEHTSEPQSLMRNSYAVFCLKKKTRIPYQHTTII